MCPRLTDDRAAFLVRHALVQDLPHEPTQAVRDRADGLGVAEATHKPPVQQFEDAALGPHRRVRALVEQSPRLTIAVWDAMTAVDAGALIVAGAGAHP